MNPNYLGVNMTIRITDRLEELSWNVDKLGRKAMAMPGYPKDFLRIWKKRHNLARGGMTVEREFLEERLKANKQLRFVFGEDPLQQAADHLFATVHGFLRINKHKLEEYVYSKIDNEDYRSSLNMGK